jgi:hypothetical protein
MLLRQRSQSASILADSLERSSVDPSGPRKSRQLDTINWAAARASSDVGQTPAPFGKLGTIGIP